ncbi:hypothetical protein PTTG_08966 [Puccinia triticina 1-1 BBBD Race 1]|uniref:Uncharacterized protein n=2 Tax=Puccinia triticina TaxID=208348 RepID=A0A180GJ95_PUCT1|nr:uncharacterized protein PtA15_8A93 [Puccinia triticina]OAV92402.1 hypothetical protein PTTG_08966 [Puccinia triticina 1-1 BBBD Race 1]WAQ87192.1 hypothetical protein PtA15_8A93 [Puccinia triticina]WAR57039.1 hypothetical protein PtB15_8B83 [Puccinia triticina]
MAFKNGAPTAEVNRFLRRIFIVATFRRCREHGDHHELSIVVPVCTGQSLVYRIAESRRRYYLSTQLLDLRTQILPGQPSPTDGSRRPMWLADIPADANTRLGLAKRLESSLRAVERPDQACSLEWVLHFIDQLRHAEFRGIDARLRLLKKTLRSQTIHHPN